jgi:ABC-type microcin C transport system permease subunit YejE
MEKRVTSGSSSKTQVSTRSLKDIDVFDAKNQKSFLSINTNPSAAASVTIQPKEKNADTNEINKSNEYPIRQISDEDELIENPSTPTSDNTSNSQKTNVDSESLDIKKVFKYVTIPGLMLGFFVTIAGIFVGVIGAFGGFYFFILSL